jgi:hypothetical protein
MKTIDFRGSDADSAQGADPLVSGQETKPREGEGVAKARNNAG